MNLHISNNIIYFYTIIEQENITKNTPVESTASAINDTERSDTTQFGMHIDLAT